MVAFCAHVKKEYPACNSCSSFSHEDKRNLWIINDSVYGMQRKKRSHPSQCDHRSVNKVFTIFSMFVVGDVEP